MKSVLSPVTKKRIARFREQRISLFALLLILTLYGLSLCSELICNSEPLYVRHNGKSYFPVFMFYPEDIFTGNGKHTRPDYKKINKTPVFSENDENYMIFPIFSYGPLESIDPDMIKTDDTVSVEIKPVGRVGRVNIRPDYTISRTAAFSFFAGRPETELKGLKISEFVPVSAGLKTAVERRFLNEPADKYSEDILAGRVRISLSSFSQRRRTPKTVRILFREIVSRAAGTETIVIERGQKIIGAEAFRNSPEPAVLKKILEKAGQRFERPVPPFRFTAGQREFEARFNREDVRFPYGPVPGHRLGIDSAGRDVFARILYGMRISMTFGLLLVVFSISLGVAAGAVQGYFGGKTDLTAQRLIEIWSALPFLYIMILMGAVYGRSFGLLLFCYGIFNWIGISYYVRAEFLKLRKQAFVESAKCMGVPTWKIIFRHILPNAMTPVITFFPFSLVGAIGSLAALDYLGFGLPPPTPSWGELFFQAQQFRWAWWLVVYPAIALFVVMLAGVFIGDGIRNAFDPKRYTRLE